MSLEVIFSFVLCLIQILLGSANSDLLMVRLPDLSTLNGTYMPGLGSTRFEVFLGVPYAKPPVGALRLKNPVPFGPWNGNLDATAAKPVCLQKNYMVPGWPTMGEEDCLYLNIYRPVRTTTHLLPVLFYIHGGGNFVGSAGPIGLGPEYFMATEEVVVVTAAYRLGPFGFLSTGDAYMPGNFGLKDQSLALKWVHDNIIAFGGDQNLVTIFGHSAGACSVHLHMLSDASKGLFHRAIMISGTALAPFVDILNDPYGQTLQVAEAAGIKDPHSLATSDLVGILSALDAQTLLNAGDSLKFWNMYPFINFKPSMEDSNWSGAFLTEPMPKGRVKNGLYTHVPMLMGIVPDSGEGAVAVLNILENDLIKQEFNNNFDEYLMKLMEFPADTPPNVIDEIMELIIEEYLQGVHELNNATEQSFMQIFGDSTYRYPFYKVVQHYVDQANQIYPLYLFQFDYRGAQSNSVFFSGGSTRDFGVVHGDDLFYLFRIAAPLNTADAQVAKNYVRFYVDFAKYGQTDKIGSCSADAFYAHNDEGICDYLEYTKQGESVNSKFNVKRMHFWDQVREKYE